jgi:hypothetical protein
VTLRFINCESSDSGRDGFHFGPGVEVIAEGLVAKGNGRDGIHVSTTLVEYLDMPADINPKELAEVLRSLQSVPVEQRSEAVLQDGLFKKISATVKDATGFAANVVTVASHPRVADFITTLLA